MLTCCRHAPYGADSSRLCAPLLLVADVMFFFGGGEVGALSRHPLSFGVEAIVRLAEVERERFSDRKQ